MSILQRALATRPRRGMARTTRAAAIPLLALAWWLGSPLFRSISVDEEFPLTVSAEVPSNITRAEVGAVMETMAKVEGKMDEAMPPAMESTRAISAGAFKDADRFHKSSGKATLYALTGDEHVLRLEEFNVTNGPDLHVLLSPHPDPASQSEVKGEGYLGLGKIKGNIGSQNYPVPQGTDVSIYRSVVIFSVAPLGPAGAG